MPLAGPPLSPRGEKDTPTDLGRFGRGKLLSVEQEAKLLPWKVRQVERPWMQRERAEHRTLATSLEGGRGISAGGVFSHRREPLHLPSSPSNWNPSSLHLFRRLKIPLTSTQSDISKNLFTDCLAGLKMSTQQFHHAKNKTENGPHLTS